EHCAVLVEDGQVAVLKQCARLYRHLVAGNTRPTQATAEHPVHTAMAMVSAPVAVLAQRSSKLTDDHDHRAAPCGLAHFVAQRDKGLPQLAQSVGKHATAVA